MRKARLLAAILIPSVAILASAGGCKVRAGWGQEAPTPRSKPAQSDPKVAIKAYWRAVKATEGISPADVLRDLAVAMSKLFSVPSCSKAIRRLPQTKHKEAFNQAIHLCLREYCRLLGDGPRLCPIVRGGHWRIDEASRLERTELDHLWISIMRYELGARHQRHIDAYLMFYSLREQWEVVAGLREPRPRRSPARREEPLRLTLVIREGGFYLKTRHGSECPTGVSDDARLCFPAPDGEITDKLLKQLQNHLWYLFASKYRRSRSHEDRSAILVIPYPTVPRQTIVRTIQAIREIPADAKNPKLRHQVPAHGCVVEYDADRKRWEFPVRNGESVEETACMYYRVTLARGILLKSGGAAHKGTPL